MQALVTPLSLEEKGLTLLQVWHDHMMRPKDPHRVAVVGTMTIWWLSLAAGTFAELRIRGKQMWAELERGIQYSRTFDLAVDIPQGLNGRTSAPVSARINESNTGNDQEISRDTICARCGHGTYDHTHPGTGYISNCYRCTCLMFADR
jgi:hypothetical protein